MSQGFNQRKLSEENRAKNASNPAENAARLRMQIRRLRNQQEFLDILANVWPLPRIVSRIEKLETHLKNLEQQLQHQKK